MDCTIPINNAVKRFKEEKDVLLHESQKLEEEINNLHRDSKATQNTLLQTQSNLQKSAHELQLITQQNHSLSTELEEAKRKIAKLQKAIPQSSSKVIDTDISEEEFLGTTSFSKHSVPDLVNSDLIQQNELLIGDNQNKIRQLAECRSKINQQDDTIKRLQMDLNDINEQKDNSKDAVKERSLELELSQAASEADCSQFINTIASQKEHIADLQSSVDAEMNYKREWANRINDMNHDFKSTIAATQLNFASVYNKLIEQLKAKNEEIGSYMSNFGPKSRKGGRSSFKKRKTTRKNRGALSPTPRIRIK